MARAFIGPDVDLRVPCTVTVQVPVASVDAVGGGCADWSIALQGDPDFTTVSDPLVQDAGVFRTCETIGPTVASVSFTPPLTAVPGDTFDAVVTVHASDGSFSDGKVKVHAVVAVPTDTIDKTAIDFGDVPLGTHPMVPIKFTFANKAVIPQPNAVLQGPFFLSEAGGSVASGWITQFVNLDAYRPGDYTNSFTWTAPTLPTPVASLLPPACLWTTTIAVHGRVVGVVDANADGDALNDSAVDGAANGP
jgi:hypothetical protein